MRIGANGEVRLRRHDLELDVSFGGGGAEGRTGLTKDPVHAHVLEVERETSRLQAHGIEQIADEPIHLVHRARRDVEQLLLLWRWFVLEQQLVARADEVQRVAEVVCDDTEHLLPTLREQLGVPAPLALGIVAKGSVQRRGRCMREEHGERPVGGTEGFGLGKGQPQRADRLVGVHQRHCTPPVHPLYVTFSSEGSGESPPHLGDGLEPYRFSRAHDRNQGPVNVAHGALQHASVEAAQTERGEPIIILAPHENAAGRFDHRQALVQHHVDDIVHRRRLRERSRNGQQSRRPRGHLAQFVIEALELRGARLRRAAPALRRPGRVPDRHMLDA